MTDCQETREETKYDTKPINNKKIDKYKITSKKQ